MDSESNRKQTTARMHFIISASKRPKCDHFMVESLISKLLSFQLYSL